MIYINGQAENEQAENEPADDQVHDQAENEQAQAQEHGVMQVHDKNHVLYARSK